MGQLNGIAQRINDLSRKKKIILMAGMGIALIIVSFNCLGFLWTFSLVAFAYALYIPFFLTADDTFSYCMRAALTSIVSTSAGSPLYWCASAGQFGMYFSFGRAAASAAIGFAYGLLAPLAADLIRREAVGRKPKE